MPKKGKKKDKPNPRTPSAKPKKSKKVVKPKTTRNPKQTTRRIPARVGARSTANITEVVAPDGSRGGIGSYARRRTPEEIQAERVANARQILGISDFPEPARQATRPAPRRVQEPVGGFTGLTSGFGITPNKTKELETKLTDMEARLKAEIATQRQPDNVNQPQRDRPQRGVLRRGDVQARRPPPEEELDATSTFTIPARTREQNRRTRNQIYQPLPVSEEGERREVELRTEAQEKTRLDAVRNELERQTQAEAKNTINKIMREANDKVKEKNRVQDIRNELDRQTKAEERKEKYYQDYKKDKDDDKEFKDVIEVEEKIITTPAPQPQPEPEPAPAPKENFKVGGEIEVPFKSQEDLLEAFRNRPNQPQPLQDIQVEEVEEDTDDEGFEDVSDFEPAPAPKKIIPRSAITQPTSQRGRPQEQDPQNLLNVSSLRRDIKDSFGQSSLEILRKEQAEREKKKEETRKEKADRERLRTRPLPERPLPVPPPFRTSTARADVGEIIDDVVDRAFDTATDNAKRLEKERKDKQRKDREDERKRIASEATKSLIGAGIRGAVDTQQRRDRGSQRAERDRSRRSATADVSGIIDDLVDRSIVQAQSKETQVRAGGQGRRGTDVEREIRDFRSRLLSQFGEGGTPDDFEEQIKRYRERLEARQVIQDKKNTSLGALMNFGVNGQYIPFNARDLIRITNTAKDRDSLSRLRDMLRNDKREEVRKLEKEIMDLAIDLIRLKKEEKDESNKIAKLRKR